MKSRWDSNDLSRTLFINPLTTGKRCKVEIYLLLTPQTTNMKYFLLSFSTLLAFTCFAQQKDPFIKRDNFFVATALSKTLGATFLDKKYGFSFVYNRLLPKSRFGVGAGLEIIDIRTKKLGGIMPTLDVRYYATLGKSTLIPLAQAGYNFYSCQYQKLGNAQAYEEKGGLGYSLGIGYSNSFSTRGSGLYGALKYRGLQYKYNDPLQPKRNTSERLNLSIGWRF